MHNTLLTPYPINELFSHINDQTKRSLLVDINFLAIFTTLYDFPSGIITIRLLVSSCHLSKFFLNYRRDDPLWKTDVQ